MLQVKTALGAVGLVMLLLWSPLSSANFQVKELKWKYQGATLDVFWLVDETFPTFDAQLYFADGVLGEQQENNGLSEAAFSLLTTGTKDYSQQQIASKLDQLAMTVQGTAGYEFSTFGFSGLIKELKPSAELFCNIYQHPSFPSQEISAYQMKLTASFKNLVSEPDQIAERAFMRLVFPDTSYGLPNNGQLASLGKINQSGLLSHWKWMTQQAKKVLFLRGPSEALALKEILLEKCGPFAGDFNRSLAIKQDLGAKKMSTASATVAQQSYFVSLPGVNQVQVRLGKVVPGEVFRGSPDLSLLSTGILGSGLTSYLMMEIRQKRGLTYGIGSVAKERSLLGYSAMYTSTRSESIVQMIDGISETLAPLLAPQWKDEDKIEKTAKFLLGRQLRNFDDSKKLFSSLMLYYHLNRPFEEILDLGKNFKKYHSADISKNWNELFGHEGRVLVMVGDPKVLPALRKLFGEQLVVKSAEEFL